MYLILSAALFLLLFFTFRTKKYRIIYIKKLILPLVCILFILLLLVFSSTSVNSAKEGLELWFFVVLPSLLPFFIVSEMLNKTGFVKALGAILEPIMRPVFNLPGCASFPLIMGTISGYPVGAKITALMRKENLLTRKESERLLAFSNNSGPLFIVGAVSVGMLKIPQCGFLLLFSHILSSLSVGIIFKVFSEKSSRVLKENDTSVYKKFRKEVIYNIKNNTYNFGSIIGESIKNSIQTILMIGGFIILFAVIINLLLATNIIGSISGIITPILDAFGFNQELTSSVLSGLMEITTGINLACQTEEPPLILKLGIISAITGWAGISVHAQVISLLASTDIKCKKYLIGKAMQSIISFIYTLILYFPLKIYRYENIPTSISVFNELDLMWYDYILYSFNFIGISLLIFICFTSFMMILNFIIKLLQLP